MVWPTVSETIQLEAEPFAQNLTPQKLIPLLHFKYVLLVFPDSWKSICTLSIDSLSENEGIDKQLISSPKTQVL